MTWSTAAKKDAQVLRSGRWVWLYAIQLRAQAEVAGIQAAINEWVLFTSWDEPITFDGNVYASYPIAHDKVEGNTKGDLTDSTLVIGDWTGFASTLLLQNDGLEGRRVLLIVVRYESLGTPANAHVEEFEVAEADVDPENNLVTLHLGQLGVVSAPFPSGRFLRNGCRFGYKAPDGRCGSTSTDPSCDLTLDGDNGCEEKENTPRFGGFPTIPVRR